MVSEPAGRRYTSAWNPTSLTSLSGRHITEVVEQVEGAVQVGP
jgi:hypothetical protein